jgi:hypothetical protein
MNRQEDAAATVRATVEVLATANVEPALREVAFEKVFEFLAQPTGRGAVDHAAGPEPGLAVPGTVPSGSGVVNLAEALGVRPEDIEYVFDLESDGISLTVRRDQLDADRTQALREAALLVATARQAVGIDPERTDSDVIRRQAVELGLVNKNSFRQEMGSMGPVVTARPRGRFGRELKVTRHGRDEASRIVKRIVASNRQR